MIDPKLDGRVVLVTGANHGIGAATARAFAAQGAAVFLTYLRLATGPDAGPPEDGAPGEALYRANQARSADAVVRAIRDRGGRAEAWEADLADPAAIPALFDRAERAFGPVEVLINNAAHCVADTFLPPVAFGPGERAPSGVASHPLTPESHDRHFAVNSRAVALTMAEFARRHAARGATWGRIVNVSTDGAPGFRGEVSYGASKHALESYSRAAAKELGRFGVTVNVVSLGPTQTGWIGPELEAAAAANTPLGRVGAPEDVADAIALLASEQARWLTGQLLFVGGGHRMV
jgi:3-oxoacyl-[acyl-carrier protein] reductase